MRHTDRERSKKGTPISNWNNHLSAIYNAWNNFPCDLTPVHTSTHVTLATRIMAGWRNNDLTPIHALTQMTFAAHMIAGWSNNAQTLLHVGGTSKETDPLEVKYLGLAFSF